ncbi:sodium/nucleoside cotransporter [Apiospora arundinis]|uniref:Protein HRI1 n=1 Tax=Apiospora arundinis TaxID=335852 RepID=A0ABR2JA89_9PEZI
MSHEESKPSISVRKYIKWGDTFPVENTSTIVLTSPKRHFVDVRLRIPLEKGVVARDPAQLDWAFAGTSSHDAGASPPHSVFRHWVDSRHEDAEAVVDEGDMVPSQQPGETVESGQMVNPDTGVMQAYEECWLDGEPEEGSKGWVLQYHDEGAGAGEGGRGLMTKIGGRVQGVLRVGKEVAVGRWEIAPGASSSSWTAVAEIGSMANTGFPTGLPAAPAIGDKVQAQDGRQWVCLEAW